MGHADPIIHLRPAARLPVPDKDLPVVLPEDCPCPMAAAIPCASAPIPDVPLPEVRASGQARRRHEGHVVDHVVYMRYTSPGAVVVDAATTTGCPWTVHRRIEHAILHLLYGALLDEGDARHGAREDRRTLHALLTQAALNHIWFGVPRRAP